MSTTASEHCFENTVLQFIAGTEIVMLVLSDLLSVVVVDLSFG